jgi:hypothetical protein
MNDENGDLLRYADELRKLGRRPEVILERAALAEAAVLEWVGPDGKLDIENVIRFVPAYMFSPTVQTYLFNLRNRAKDGGAFDLVAGKVINREPGDEAAVAELLHLGMVIGEGSPNGIAELTRKTRAAAWRDRVDAKARAMARPNVLDALEAVAEEIAEEDPTVFRGDASGPALRERIKRGLTDQPGDVLKLESLAPRMKGKRGRALKRK